MDTGFIDMVYIILTKYDLGSKVTFFWPGLLFEVGLQVNIDRLSHSCR